MRVALALALLAAGPAAAQTAFDRVEMAGHRALERTRAAQLAPAPFTTDGCSGGMSAAWAGISELLPGFAATHGAAPPWEECCVIHDRAYHSAGPDPAPGASFRARRSADLALKSCVSHAADGQLEALAEAYGVGPAEVIAAYEWVAWGMFQAVRAGGAPCSGLSWRWGYGYPSCWVGWEDWGPRAGSGAGAAQP